ncbi:MAG: response regulator transcription factor [Wenzhouxiangellaceae bacterium]
MSTSQSLLIVEDDEVFGAVLSDAMTARNYNVRLARNPTGVHRIVDDFRPDFAVLDLNLEGDCGLDLIEPLKAANADVRILILTGYASIATAVDAIRRGAAEYLTKPADADQIDAALQGMNRESPAEVPNTPMSVRRLEWEHVQRVLSECDGNISEAARRLNMHRRTLQRKLQKRPMRR